MNKTKLFRSALLAAAALAFTGCIDTFPESDIVEVKPLPAGTLKIADSLKEDFKIIRVYKSQTEGHFVTYKATFRLKRDGFWAYTFSSYKDCKIAYRFVWYDDNGKEAAVENPEEYKWLIATVRPGNLITFSTTAPSSKLKRVSLFIKPAQELTEADKNAHKTAKKAVKKPSGTKTSMEKMMENKPAVSAKTPEKEGAKPAAKTEADPKNVKKMMQNKPAAPAKAPDKVEAQALTESEKAMAPKAK